MENNVLKTGYRRLDNKDYGGIKRGELTMLYARIGVGASAFLSNVFLNMLSQIPSTKCMFFAFDEPKKNTFEKMVCMKSGFSYWQYCNGEAWTEKVRQTEKWLEEKLQSKTAKSYIIDKVQSLAELLLCVAEAKASCGLDAVFVDNLEYLRDYAAEDVNHVIFILKELAVRLDIAVVVSAYLPRGTRFPIRSRIKNKYVLRTADKIAILNRPEVFATADELEDGCVIRGAAELIVIKNYTGLCGYISLKFDKGTMRFYEPEEFPFEEEGY